MGVDDCVGGCVGMADEGPEGGVAVAVAVVAGCGCCSG